MLEPLCSACGANPPVAGRLCVCCQRDRVQAQRIEQEARDRQRIEARRRGRPMWKPDHGDRGHGLGHGSRRGEHGRDGP